MEASIPTSDLEVPFDRNRDIHPTVAKFAAEGGFKWNIPESDKLAITGHILNSESVWIRKASALQMLEETIRMCSDMAYDYDFQRLYHRNHIQSRGRWLTLLGTSGNGKTHLGKRICAFRQAHLKMFNAANRGWTQMEQQLKSGKWAHLENFFDVQLLVIDDLFAGQDSEMTMTKLYDLLNRRIGQFTVITSNLTLAEMGEREARIASRIAREPGNVVVELSKNVKSYNSRRNA